jgi:hypothetical protein
MENNPKRNIYYTFCHIIFCFCFSENIVIAFRIVFHSIPDLKKKNSPIMLFYLFIFAVTVKCILIQKNKLFQNGYKKYTKLFKKTKLIII